MTSPADRSTAPAAGGGTGGGAGHGAGETAPGGAGHGPGETAPSGGSPGVRSAGVPARGLRHAFGALEHRDLARFVVGAFLSNVGTWMQNVTVPYVLFQLTGSATWVGFGAFMQFIPSLFVGPLAGVIADRLPRRRTVLLTQTLGLAAASTLFLTWVTGHRSPWLIVVIVGVNGLTMGLVGPSWQSFLAELVPPAVLPRAVALNGMQFNAARAIGPAVAGIALNAFGPGGAFFVNALSYLAVIVPVLGIAPRPAPANPSGEGPWASLRAGLTYIRRHRPIAVAIVLVVIMVFLGNPTVQLVAVLATDEYGVGRFAYSMLIAVFGAGAVLGSLFVGAYGEVFPRSRTTVVGLLVYGLAIVGLAASPSYPAGLVALGLIGFIYVVALFSVQTSVHLIVDDAFRGRVFAVYFMAFTGGFPIGALLQGRLADVIGVRQTLAIAGGLLVVTGLVLVARPGIAALLDGRRAPARAAPA